MFNQIKEKKKRSGNPTTFNYFNLFKYIHRKAK